MAEADEVVSVVPVSPPRRDDIDGLRGVAIMLVLVHHLHREWLPWGFVGVDVFFVISGYVVAQMFERNQDLCKFYARRVSRLVPASLVVSLCTLLASYVLLLPMELACVVRASMASSVAMANFYYEFVLPGGYFGSEAMQSPFLHFWSLSVEWQFYAVWPLLHSTLALCAVPVRIAVVIALIAASFGGTSLFMGPTAAYYLLPSRAGELLFGVLARLIQQQLTDEKSTARDAVLAFTGVALLGTTALWLNPDVFFPGVLATVPCVGTALILVFGVRFLPLRVRLVCLFLFCICSPFGQALLSAPFLVTVGHWSYSIYLFHWPIFVMLRNADPAVIGAPPEMVAVMATAIVGGMSFIFIERPAQRWLNSKSLRVTATVVVVNIAVVALVMIAVSTSAAVVLRGTTATTVRVRNVSSGGESASADFVRNLYLTNFSHDPWTQPQSTSVRHLCFSTNLPNDECRVGGPVRSGCTDLLLVREDLGGLIMVR
jgi:peptidoglycan/LPS O-acetylase OafA/YrhL